MNVEAGPHAREEKGQAGRLIHIVTIGFGMPRCVRARLRVNPVVLYLHNSWAIE